MIYKKYRRQFVIMKKPYEAEGFRSIQIANGFFLSFEEGLPVSICNETAVLIGEVFSCYNKKTAWYDEPLSQMRYWAGRWVLLYDNKLYLDACGLLGCFFATDTNGEIVISSSLAIIKDVTNAKWISNHEVKRGEFKGVFDFYPIPFTPLEGVVSLLPSQFFDFDIKRVCRRTDYNFNRFVEIDQDDALTEFIDATVRILQAIDRKYHGYVWIPLTGGVDSRTVLALSIKAGIDFRLYTVNRDDIKSWDYNTPKKIAKKIGVYHEYLECKRPVPGNKIKQANIIEQCAGMTSVGTETIQYEVGIDVENAEKSMILWGTGWELCSKYYNPYFSQIHDKAEAFSEYERVCGSGLHDSNVHALSLNAWLDECYEHPVEGIDLRERQYWEQREGAWLRYAYQVYDLFDSKRITPINCQYLLELLISINTHLQEKQIVEKQIEKKIVSLCCPQISRIPYGEPTGILYRLIRKGKKLIKNI